MKKLFLFLSLGTLAIVAAIGVLTFALPSSGINPSFPQDGSVAHNPGSSEAHDHPDAPTLAATAGDGQITISWQTVTGASHYEIWVRKGTDPWTQANTTALPATATSFIHTGLTDGETYFYTARSANASGVISPWSPQVEATVNPELAAPVLTATAGVNQIAISWQAVTGAAGYELWAWEETADWVQIDDGSLTATSFTHSNLDAGLTYYYQIRTLNNNDNPGPWSDKVHATVYADLDPPVLTATAGDGQISISWPTVTDAHGYQIWTAQDGTEWEQADDGSLTGSSTSFTHTGLTSGDTYYYLGRSITAAGHNGLFGQPVAATVPVTLTAPTLTLTPSHAQIALSWQAITGADSYELWTWQEGADWVQLDDGSLTATSFTHASLTVGSKHYYAVRALSDDGTEGAWSEYVGAIAAGELSTPVLTATASGAQITITWQAVTGADTYELWYWISGSDWQRLDDGTLAATSYTHTGLTTGTTYLYTLRALSNDGKESAWSEHASATP